jgi:glutamine synthetase
MQINIEARTMLNIARRLLMPAALKFARNVSDTAVSVKNAGSDSKLQVSILNKVCDLTQSMQDAVGRLEKEADAACEIADASEQAFACRKKVVPAMQALRTPADELETIVDATIWPLPSYAEMLFVK